MMMIVIFKFCIIVKKCCHTEKVLVGIWYTVHSSFSETLWQQGTSRWWKCLIFVNRFFLDCWRIIRKEIVIIVLPPIIILLLYICWLLRISEERSKKYKNIRFQIRYSQRRTWRSIVIEESYMINRYVLTQWLQSTAGSTSWKLYYYWILHLSQRESVITWI